MNVYFDTSVLVEAFAVKGHAHHASTYNALEHALRGKHRAYISSHGLAEFYAVLMRVPFTPPVYPQEVWRILEESILPNVTVVAFTAAEYLDVLCESAVQGWVGGRIYDMLRLRCAQKQECERIYTFNVRHFREMAPVELADRVCSP